MSIHGPDDHELKVGSTTKRLQLIRDDNGSAMYQVIEDIPNYQNPFLFTQTDWIGGHGQHDFALKDLYFEGQSIDTTQEGRILLGPLINEVKEDDDTDLDSAPVVFMWYKATGELLCATSGKIYRYDVSSSGKWTAATTTVASVTDLAEYNGVAYAAVGSSTLYYYSTDGDTWTQTDLTDGYAQKFFVSPNPAGTQNVLWKFKTPNELSETTNGKTVAAGGIQWSSAAYIGDSSYNITNIFLINSRFMIGREDNLFNYDSDGGTHPLMDDLKHNRTSQNFKYVTQWQTGTYSSLGTGLCEMIGGKTVAFEPMGPLTNIDDIGKTGICVGLASDKDWLYPVMDEGTNTIIYKGREVRKSGTLRWEWCPWVFLSTTTCATAKVVQHSSTDRRLWFGYGNSTAYVILTDNPTADSAARFCASGFIRMSYVEGTNLYWDKMIQSMVTQTEACTSNLTITPKYRKDAETSATSLTSAITTNGTVKTNLTSALSCNRIQYELHFATNSSTTTPELSFLEIRGVEKPETTRVHECVYALGDEPTKVAETLRTFLRGARTSTSLIKFADLRYKDKTTDTSYTWVIVQPGFPQEVEILHERRKQPEMGLKVRFQEISYTVS